MIDNQYFKLIVSSCINTTTRLNLIKPDKLGFEVTNENTIYYKLQKGDYSLHIETYFYFGDIEEDLVVSLFKGDESVLNVAGSLDKVFIEINKFI